MRKLTKVLVLVAAFTALFALTALAKTGWNSDENGWYYVGTDGEWIKGETRNSNGKIYYLDDETGYMVTNKKVDIGDYAYYFGEDGARVKDQWISLPADEDDESGETYRWYRFKSNGQAVTSNNAFKVGDNYYGFDADGKMLFGFVDDDYKMINEEEDAIAYCSFYYGDNTDGALKTGWFEYTDGFSKVSEKSTAWFYFKPKKGNKYYDCTELIGQKKYTFDDYGIMQTGWATASPDTATKSYWNADGTKKKSAWVYAARLDDTDASAWYYLDGNGYADKELAGKVKYLKKKYYVFNPAEKDPYMLSGLTYLNGNDIAKASLLVDGTTGAKVDVPSLWADVKKGGHNLYYFSKNENAGGGVDGWAVTGAVDVDFDDATVTMYFDKYTYCALQGVKDNYLYNYGQLQTAGDTYNVKKVGVYDETKKDYVDTWFFVGSNGKVVTKAGKYQDANGAYYVKTDAASNVPQYFVADYEYAYQVKNNKGEFVTKYASAATVAKYLAGGSAKIKEWNEMSISKTSQDFADAMNALME